MKKELKFIKEENLPEISKEISKEIQDFFKKNDRACIVFLNGDLGAGKTTFTKYLAKNLGIEDNVISPTFVLRKDYGNVIHIDGYRFEKEEEAIALALDREIEEKGKIILIEWPERFVNFYNLKPDINIEFEHAGEDERHIFVNSL